MKKILKICLTLAVSLFLIGLIIIAVSFAFGGQGLIEDLVQGKGNINLGNIRGPHIYLDLDDWEEEGGTIYAGNQEKMKVADGSAVKNLKLDIGAASIIILESEDESYWLETQTDGEIKCDLTGNVLIVRGIKNDSINNNSKIYLYVPANADLEKIELDLGAGKAECDKLHADEISIDLGAGSVECDAIEADILDTDIGAGSIRISDGLVEEGKFSVSMGELIFEGAILNDVNADCAMGSMEFHLEAGQNDYNYHVECAAGNVSIGAREYSHLASDMNIDNNATRDFDIDCAMGSIELDFNK